MATLMATGFASLLSNCEGSCDVFYVTIEAAHRAATAQLEQQRAEAPTATVQATEGPQAAESDHVE